MDIAVVTGATSGIGTLMARGLAQAGYRVIVCVRDVAKAKALGFTDVEAFDAAEPASVAAVAQKIRAAHPHIAVLMNNAGVHLKTRQTNAAGVEKVFATNVLAYHVMTRVLEADRIVNTASTFSGGLDLTDPLYEKRTYDATAAYKASKEADCLLTRAWARRRPGKSVNAFSPGLIYTGLYREVSGPFMRILATLVGNSAARGANAGLALALGDHGTARFFDREKEKTFPFADEAREEALFALCERLTERVEPGR